MANQNEAEIHFKSGNDFYQQRNYIEACKAFQKAIEIDPNYVDAYNRWGNALYGLERYDEAIEKYQKAIERNFRDNPISHGFTDRHWRDIYCDGRGRKEKK